MSSNRTPYVEGFAKRLAKMAAAPKLDVQVCDHCNLRCAGCLHFAPLAKPRFLDLEEYARELERLSAIDGIGGYFDTVVLMGGEPLLHPRIAEVVRVTREYLPSERVTLCTNGLLLKHMGDDFWSALSHCDVALAISPYPLKFDYDKLAEFARSRGVNVLFTADITGTAEGKEVFMHLALDPEGDCDPVESFTSCPFGGCFLQLAHGAIWPCQVTAHHGAFAQRFDYAMHDEPDDSLRLESISSTEEIEAFRRRSHPMCRYCNNNALTVAPWERSALAADEWLV